MEKVISERQVFTPTVQGGVEFSHVQVLFQQDNQFFLGHRHQRRCSAIDQSDLYNVVAISPDCYQPTLPPHTTLLHYTERPIYIKRPNLSNYTSPSSISVPLLREIEVCEVLLNNPHPNVATYLGCKALGDRLDGICFELYPQNLMSMLNPGSLNKKELLESRHCSLEVAEKYILGIEAGIRHLHSLGYVHNDINPMNIMISGEGVPVIIDFDSCVKVDESVENLKRTYGWYDKDEKLARESNDLNALREIRAWLTGTSADEFQYPV
ncbi:Serine/threonine-protein kinase/endoribonuclease IRE1 [Metarhizium anisopliae]|nr:Serine/threonine-protein kinase/endoribonuclease IRE1 [Metarhizium anisopliae]